MNGIHVLKCAAPDDMPEDGVPCCMGLAVGNACTCWETVYDQPQAKPKPKLPVVVRPEGLCADCACRPGAPEREDGEHPVEELALRNKPFYCHDGMRRAIAEVHPDGRRREVGPGNYDPPVLVGGSVPFKADGSPAFICAGWDALAKAGA